MYSYTLEEAATNGSAMVTYNKLYYVHGKCYIFCEGVKSGV